MGIRKLKAGIAALTAALLMTGCGQGESKPAQTSADTSPAETNPPVAVTLPPASSAETETQSAAGDSFGGDKDNADGVPCNPAMWKVTSGDGKEMLMMGSMHALDDACYPLPDYITEAYDSCEVLAVECDITDALESSAVQLKYSDKLNYPQGETITDHISAETWQGLCGYFEHYGCDPAKYENVAAWNIYSAIQSISLEGTDLSSEKGLDRHFLDQAHKDKREIYEVESLDFQLSMLMGFSDQIYDLLLSEYTAENAENVENATMELFRAWKAGDLDWVEKSSQADYGSVSDELKAEIDSFMNSMYTDRNKHMTKDAEELINSGKKVFYMVGLAHFLGEDGIIARLEDDGYTVDRIH